MTKNNTPSFSLVIPVYNNEKTVMTQLTKCIEVMKSLTSTWEIILGDDASSDKTKELLTKYQQNSRVKIYHHKKNKGIADNLQFLYTKATHEYIGLFSVDGDWNPEDIQRMFHQLLKTKSDMIIGLRKKENYSFYRRTISFLYSSLPPLLFGTPVIDPGSIKIFRRELLTCIIFQSKSVFFEAELIIKAQKLGYTISSIPITHKRGRLNRPTGGQMKYLIPAFSDMIKLRMEGLRYE